MAITLRRRAARTQAVGLPIARVSQGSGIFMHGQTELTEMLRVARDNAMELCLFVGPRMAWDTSATARTEGGRNVAGHRGMDQVTLFDERHGTAVV